MKATPKKREKPKGSGRKAILTVEAVAAAIVEHSGNISAVARRFNVDRSSVSHFIANNERLGRVVYDQKERRIDDAESALDKALRSGEAWAVCFFLKTQGKKRGYIEKQQLELGEMGSTEVVEEIIVTRSDPVDAAAGRVP